MHVNLSSVLLMPAVTIFLCVLKAWLKYSQRPASTQALIQWLSSILLALTYVTGIQPFQQLFDTSNAEVLTTVCLGYGHFLNLKETSTRGGGVLLLGEARSS